MNGIFDKSFCSQSEMFHEPAQSTFDIVEECKEAFDVVKICYAAKLYEAFTKQSILFDKCAINTLTFMRFYQKKNGVEIDLKILLPTCEEEMKKINQYYEKDYTMKTWEVTRLHGCIHEKLKS